MQVPGPGDRFAVRTDGTDSHGVGAQSRASDGAHLTQSEKQSQNTRLDQRSKKRLYSETQETEASFHPSTNKTAHEVEAALDLLEGRVAKLSKKDPELLHQLLSERLTDRESALAQALRKAVGADETETASSTAEILQDRPTTSATISRQTHDPALADYESMIDQIKQAESSTEVCRILSEHRWEWDAVERAFGAEHLGDVVWRTGKQLFEHGVLQSEIEEWGDKLRRWTDPGRMLDCLREEYTRDSRRDGSTASLGGLDLRLKGLDLHKYQLPPTLVFLVDMSELRLDRCNLSVLPEIPTWRNLGLISAGRNAITAIPEWVTQIELVDLYLNDNQIAHFPEELYRCETLSVLNLNYNPIRSLPSNIDELHNINCLYVCGTQIETLPDSLVRCTHLGELDISQTRLLEFPRVIESLPNLHKLYVDEAQFSRWHEFLMRLKNSGIFVTAAPRGGRLRPSGLNFHSAMT